MTVAWSDILALPEQSIGIALVLSSLGLAGVLGLRYWQKVAILPGGIAGGIVLIFMSWMLNLWVVWQRVDSPGSLFSLAIANFLMALVLTLVLVTLWRRQYAPDLLPNPMNPSLLPWSNSPGPDYPEPQQDLQQDLQPELRSGADAHNPPTLEQKIRARTASLIAINTVLQQQLNHFQTKEMHLQQQMAQLQQIIDENVDGILIINQQGLVRYVNPAAETLFGRSANELLELDLGIPLDSTSHHDIQILRQTDMGMATINVEMRVATIEWNGEAVYLASLRDMTSRRRNEEQLAYAASHDGLTGLPNRAQFMDYLTQTVAEAQSNPDYLFALLFIDLDNFKTINDTLGHQAGDDLLKTVAQRLRQCLRPTDRIARLGGDEFTILLEEINGVQSAITIAERIHQTLGSPFLLSGRECYTTASIGIVFSGATQGSPTEFLSHADQAMYSAKYRGRGYYEVFGMDLYACVHNRPQFNLRLQQAIEHQQLCLHYQPIVDLKSDRIQSVEALVRWQDPDYGIVLPADFIPLAEETDMIIPLGTWVLREACRQAKQWQQQFAASPPLAVSVNLSSKQLIHPEFLDLVDRTLAETNLEPQYLNLEITERVIVESSKVKENLLHELRARGISLSIDDFGTGYSALSYLHRLPINILKIDASFVHRMMSDRESLEIVRAIMTLAQAVNLQVTAEGVETQEQCSQLRQLNCLSGQGQLFSAAQPVSKITELLALQMRNQCSQATVASPSCMRVD